MQRGNTRMSWPERMRSTASCTVRIAWITSVVESARPGVGEQDLRLERQPVEDCGQCGDRCFASAQLFFEPDEGGFKLGDLGGGTGSPRRRHGRNPHSSSPSRDVPRQDFSRRIDRSSVAPWAFSTVGRGQIGRG